MFIIYLLISKLFNSKLFIVFKKNFFRNNKYFLFLLFLWYVFIILFKMYVDKKQKFKNKLLKIKMRYFIDFLKYEGCYGYNSFFGCFGLVFVSLWFLWF